MKILTVVGARPNFVKLAALRHAFSKYEEIEHVIVHTGQHYDGNMSGDFFRDLDIPRPDYNLLPTLQSLTVSDQVARAMSGIAGAFKEESPDWVVVVGDVSASVAAAMTAKYMGLKVAHVEAGLRSFDWGMPEEINRVIVDRIADKLFCTEPVAVNNLRHEGRSRPDEVYLVGSVMADTLLRFVPPTRDYIQEEYAMDKRYAVLTMHRPSNVDDMDMLKAWMHEIANIGSIIHVIFPAHPRTMGRMKAADYCIPEGVDVIAPVQYLDMVALMRDAAFVMTDSGGIQEETTILGTPCLTLRDNTERLITVHEGTNTIVGADPSKLLLAVEKALANPKTGRVPELWDGSAAERIAEVLLR